MGANHRPKTYVLAGGAMVTPETRALIKRFAAREERAIAYIIRKLIEESPRVKAELRNGKPQR